LLRNTQLTAGIGLKSRAILLVRSGRRSEHVVELIHQAAQIRALKDQLTHLTGDRPGRD